jgi:hypothetical protein
MAMDPRSSRGVAFELRQVHPDGSASSQHGHLMTASSDPADAGLRKADTQASFMIAVATEFTAPLGTGSLRRTADTRGATLFWKAVTGVIRGAGAVRSQADLPTVLIDSAVVRAGAAELVALLILTDLLLKAARVRGHVACSPLAALTAGVRGWRGREETESIETPVYDRREWIDNPTVGL